MYSLKESIHISIIIIYLIFVLLSTLFVFIYINNNNKKSYYLLERRQYLLLITTLGVITSGPLDIFIIGFNYIENERYIFIKTVISYIFIVPCYISYIYRGLVIYFDCIIKHSVLHENIKNIEKSKNIKKYIKIIFVLFYIIIIIYVIYLIVIYYNEPVILSDKSYAFYIISSVYAFIAHPLIIYLLYKVNNYIKYDYILTMIICSSFSLSNFIYDYLNAKNSEIFIIYLIKIYSTPLFGMMNYFIYFMVPLINICIKNNIKNKSKKNTPLIKMYDNKIDDIRLDFLIEYDKVKDDNNDPIVIANFLEIIDKMEKINIYNEDINNIKEKILEAKMKIIDKNNDINLKVFNDLSKKVHDDVLIEIYKNLD